MRFILHSYTCMYAPQLVYIYSSLRVLQLSPLPLFSVSRRRSWGQQGSGLIRNQKRSRFRKARRLPQSPRHQFPASAPFASLPCPCPAPPPVLTEALLARPPQAVYAVIALLRLGRMLPMLRKLKGLGLSGSRDASFTRQVARWPRWLGCGLVRKIRFCCPSLPTRQAAAKVRPRGNARGKQGGRAAPGLPAPEQLLRAGSA